MYELCACNDIPIQGRFYEIEITKVIKEEDDLWQIEKIIKRRGRGKRAQILVKWKHYPVECSSWILESKVKDV